MTEIKDYIHLYFGCEVLITFGKNKGQRGNLTSISANGNYYIVSRHIVTGVRLSSSLYEIDQFKLILRPLSDITKEEREQLDDIELGESSWPTVARALAPCFVWMLSKHFDLFGLIDAGLAIDKTKIKEE